MAGTFAGQPALLPGPEGELARALPARVADHDARRPALAGGAARAGHDRVPRRAHRPARRLRHRRRRVSAPVCVHLCACVCACVCTLVTDRVRVCAQVQGRAAGGAAPARGQQELLLRHRPEQPRHLHESQRGGTIVASNWAAPPALFTMHGYPGRPRPDDPVAPRPSGPRPSTCTLVFQVLRDFEIFSVYLWRFEHANWALFTSPISHCMQGEVSMYKTIYIILLLKKLGIGILYFLLLICL